MNILITIDTPLLVLSLTKAAYDNKIQISSFQEASYGS